MTDLLHFAEHRLQEVALAFMGLVYVTRIVWFLRFKPGRDRQAPTGRSGTGRTRGILYSWGIVAMPWAMESTRTHVWLYAQFVVFHVGVVAAIALSFVIPYAPSALEAVLVVRVFQVAIGAAFLVGVIRIGRRFGNQYMRAISSPDDYFSLVLLTVWFLFGVLAAPNDAAAGEGALLTFFLLTAFFLVYVPFSKISHYLYYPFTRYYLGQTLGHRGVYPLSRV